jgi:hydroxymethylglutaryl-CoA reductase
MAGTAKKFYEMSIAERRSALIGEGAQKDSIESLSRPSAPEELEGMIENTIGAGSLPIGVVRDFVMNGKKCLVPMMLEEPSVVAAASKACKLSLPGGFTAESLGNEMIGQIQVKVNDAAAAKRLAEKARPAIEKLGKEAVSSLERYGGGWRGISFKKLKTFNGDYLIADFYVDVGNAMGANRINTAAEELGQYVAEAANGRYVLRILSNLATRRMVKARAAWAEEKIGKEGVDGVIDAYAFALSDPYRLATNNKGAMNGIDAVALATGNDWRAIEAGLHTYSALIGMKPFISYAVEKGSLIGTFEGPLAVATAGGAVGTLKHAKACLSLLGVKSASELAQVMGCIGLANNFAALYALSTEGIQKGHMRLHARNIAIQAGAAGSEADAVAARLAEMGKYDSDSAASALLEVRKGKNYKKPSR